MRMRTLPGCEFMKPGEVAALLNIRMDANLPTLAIVLASQRFGSGPFVVWHLKIDRSFSEAGRPSVLQYSGNPLFHTSSISLSSSSPTVETLPFAKTNMALPKNVRS